MKRLLFVLLLILTLTLSACGDDREPVTSLEIFGTRDRILPAFEEVDVYRYITVTADTGDSYLDQLEVTSDNCTIADGIITSDIVIDCIVTYRVEVDDAFDETTITISFREPYRTLEVIEEFNNLRIYQIYVSAYRDGLPGGYDFGYGPSDHNGDLQGIIDALDYIASLGVNAIWLTPIFESKEDPSHGEFEKRGRPTGYFADDYYNIDPNFGTNELFQEFVDEAHDRGLYVFLDGVFGHHGGYPIEGVLDGDPQWYGYETVYPESLDYFIGVATHWIEEYGIDGWRLDQSYQLYQDNYNYFREIRNAVEDLAAEREARGEEWGTLGYMVAEVWDTPSNIQRYAYDQNAFRSAFNFPLRFELVRALAIDEYNNQGSLYNLNLVMNNNYSDFAQPNLFLSNHDTVRFGDLLQIAEQDDEYFERHKLALSFLTAYTGPITIYYGDEYGDQFDGLTDSLGELNSYPYIAVDNVGRTNGRIDTFTTSEQALIDHLRTLMSLRDTYDSLWNGTRDNLLVNDTMYVDLKTSATNQVVYAMNIGDALQSITLDASAMNGTTLRNLITGETFTISNDSVTVDVSGLTGAFFLVE